MDSRYKFHEVTYESTIYGPKDNSSSIALTFAKCSRQTSQSLSEAGRNLVHAIQDLALAIGEGQTLKEIGNYQERYRNAAEEFDGLHRKWATQATSALGVFRDYWTSDQGQD